jgi:hypothetical protein
MALATVTAAQAIRTAGGAAATGPQIMKVGLGARHSLVGQSRSGQGRYRDSGEEGISQKSSHLNSPWLGFLSTAVCRRPRENGSWSFTKIVASAGFGS